MPFENIEKGDGGYGLPRQCAHWLAMTKPGPFRRRGRRPPQRSKSFRGRPAPPPGCQIGICKSVVPAICRQKRKAGAGRAGRLPALQLDKSRFVGARQSGRQTARAAFLPIPIPGKKKKHPLRHGCFLLLTDYGFLFLPANSLAVRKTSRAPRKTARR